MAKNDTPPAAGHNSGAFVSKELASFIERIEHLDEEKAGIADDRKNVFAEAKGKGFDAAIIREVLKRRKKSKDDLQEWDDLVELYEDSLVTLLS